jgi:MFS family permease
MAGPADTAAAPAEPLRAGAPVRVGGTRAALGARVFYGYVNMVAGVLMVASGVGIVQVFAVFIAPLEEAFGWSRQSISVAYAINFALFGFSSVLMGALADRYGTRRMSMVGGSLHAVGLVLAASSNSLWGLYLTFGVISGIGVGALFGPLTYLTAKWFDRRKGLAMGIVLSGTGVGVMVASPLARALIEWGGWRSAFLGLGLLTLVIVVGMGALLCEAPEDLGQFPDGVSAPAALAGGAGAGWTTATAVRTGPFWALLGVFFFCCASHSGPSLHMVAHAAGRGMSAAAATGVLTTFGAFSIAGRVGLGIAADWLGGKRCLVFALMVQTAAALWLALAEAPWAFYAFGIIFGLAYGGVYAQYPVLTRDYFGATRVGAVYGTQMCLSQLGMAIGGYGVGALFDLTGNYRDPFLASAFSGLLALALSLSLYRPAPPSGELIAACGVRR